MQYRWAGLAVEAASSCEVEVEDSTQECSDLDLLADGGTFGKETG